MNVYHDEYLAHYGVMGMKWGVRKGYQDSSGRITSKGNQYLKKVKQKSIRSDKSLTSFGKIEYGRAMDKKEYLVGKMDRAQRKIDKKGSTEKREKKLAKRKEELSRLTTRINKVYGDIPANKLADARAFYEGQKAAAAALAAANHHTNQTVRRHYNSAYARYNRR